MKREYDVRMSFQVRKRITLEEEIEPRFVADAARSKAVEALEGTGFSVHGTPVVEMTRLFGHKAEIGQPVIHEES